MRAGALDNTWNRILGKIESKVSPHSFNTWFKPTRFLSEDTCTLSIKVPNNWYAEWLKTNYHQVIQEALRELARPGLTVQFQTEAAAAAVPERAGRAAEGARVAEPRPTGVLNPRYTFDTFVASSCNQFAHAAAMAVAEQPKRAYNPLYIYGGVGLGKTHLMQAIGNRAGRTGMRLHYITSERFMNDLINAIRFERTHEFKAHYRSVDLLLIDDVQFLAGKERTQEEFFHTFNELYDTQRQIVLTSDVPPRDIPTLEFRLRSRFEWGLIADIQPPDLETKVAILRKKSEAEELQLADDVALFIASTCSSNIRELEGALIRVVAYSSVARQPITLSLAREALSSFMGSESQTVSAETIQKLVADYYKIKVNELKSRSHSRSVAFPRQVAMYLCKQLTHCSLQEIGRKFGGKHHSTVIHSIRKIEEKRVSERDFDKVVEHFRQALK